MKAIVTVLLLALAGCVTRPAVASDCARAVEEVRRVERAWLDAYETHDSAAMQRILADDFSITHADGSIQSRDDVVASVRTPRPVPAPSFRTDEVLGRCYGQTVILTGWVIDGREHRSRYTDTYVRLGGRWRVVASHLSDPPRRANGSVQQHRTRLRSVEILRQGKG